jgi:hypothetical protein
MAVYESTLQELEMSGRVQTHTSAEIALMTQYETAVNEKGTYVLFLDAAAAQRIQPIVRTAFEQLGIKVTDWNYRNMSGLRIALPREEAMLHVMDPDPITLDQLQASGFQLVARLSDQRQPFNQARVESLLQSLTQAGVKRIVFDGDTVTGFNDEAKRRSLDAMAALMDWAWRSLS